MLIPGAGTAIVDFVELLACGFHHVKRVPKEFFQGQIVRGYSTSMCHKWLRHGGCSNRARRRSGLAVRKRSVSYAPRARGLSNGDPARRKSRLPVISALRRPKRSNNDTVCRLGIFNMTRSAIRVRRHSRSLSRSTYTCRQGRKCWLGFSCQCRFRSRRCCC
jgi:hypothetical protein